MVSFIIVSKDANKGIEYVNKQCDTLNISQFDRINLSKDTQEKATTQSIGIAEIKSLQKKLYLKPMQGSDKAVIIQNGEIITNEAQNALLKVLEEPPLHTYIYVLTDSLYALLPTIRSRCKIISIDQEENITQESTDAMGNFLQLLPSMSISAKLAIVEKQAKQKQTAVEWLDTLFFVLRVTLTNHVQEEREREVIAFYLQLAKNLQQTRHTIQETNINIRLALEDMLLRV